MTPFSLVEMISLLFRTVSVVRKLILQELAYRRPSVQKATDWQSQLSKSVSISKSSSSNGGVNGASHGNDAEGDDGLAAAKVGLGAVIVLGGIYAARKLLKR